MPILIAGESDEISNQINELVNHALKMIEQPGPCAGLLLACAAAVSRSCLFSREQFINLANQSFTAFENAQVIRTEKS